MQKKILVALDNSHLDYDTGQYFATIFSKQPEAIFHLRTIVKRALNPNSITMPHESEAKANLHPRQQLSEKKHRQHLDHLCQKLCKEFELAPEQLVPEIIYSFQSVANCLLKEGKEQSYDALIIARRDLPAIYKAISGSTTSDIINKNRTLPVWVISGQPKGTKILIPVDCSIYSLDAVDHAGFILAENPHAEITLFHSTAILARTKPHEKEQFYGKWGKEWCDQHLTGDYHINAARQILRDAGVKDQRVTTIDSHIAIEPARNIVKIAKAENFSTIVLGRRPPSHKSIFQGVSDRVLANISDTAVWLIG